jgi:hypothetical protein
MKEGEELFLDYGNDWEERAWKEHVANRNPSDEDKAYMSARQWNKKHANDVLRTLQEQQNNPYPSNLVLRCHPVLGRTDWYSFYNRVPWKASHHGHACSVLNRTDESGSATYTVQMLGNNST